MVLWIDCGFLCIYGKFKYVKKECVYNEAHRIRKNIQNFLNKHLILIFR